MAVKEQKVRTPLRQTCCPEEAGALSPKPALDGITAAFLFLVASKHRGNASFAADSAELLMGWKGTLGKQEQDQQGGHSAGGLGGRQWEEVRTEESNEKRGCGVG